VAVDVVSVLVKVVDLVSVLVALLIRRFSRAHQTGSVFVSKQLRLRTVCVRVWTHESPCLSVNVCNYVTVCVCVCLYLRLY
jgi:hypothetical protein